MTDLNPLESLYFAALEKAPADRVAFLQEACSNNPELREQVERLLSAKEKAGEFLQPPAITGTFPPNQAALQPTSDFPGRDESVGTILVGKYKLIEVIGEGGMGSVFMAQQIEPVKRVVAVKVIKAGMDSKAILARFEAERQALAMMDHPNIARVLDAGTTESGRPFFVMELVKGVPITQFCDERKLTARERLELFVPVCQAIQHAHQKGIIHRDIKPSNVLVALYDDRPVPKIIDFGVAKAAGQPLTDKTLMTGFGAVVGTPEYMSPEQASFNQLDVDTRSDIYSLGVLLYELLTGTPPHPRKQLEKAGLMEILRVIREVEPPRPSARLSSSDTIASIAAVRGTEPMRLTRLVRGEIDWIVMKALEKDRTRRYESANGFAAEIQRYLAGEPVQAVPPSVGYRLRKFVRRHRAAVVMIAAFLLMLVGATAVSTWQAIIANQARKDANEQRDETNKAREAETLALSETEKALTDSREKTARISYERAQTLCEEGKADLGLLWMARSLELTPPQAKDLELTIRRSLNLWARQHCTFRIQPTQSELPKEVDIASFAVSPDDRSVLTVDLNGVTEIRDLPTNKLRFILPLEKDAPPPGSNWGKVRTIYSADGRFVAATREDRRVRIWNIATGQLVGRPLVHKDLVRGISFDPTGKILATSAGKKIHFWNVDRGVEEGEPLILGKAVEEEIGGVEFSSDGQHLLAWSQNRSLPDQVLIWDWPSRKLRSLLSKLDLFLPIQHVCFSPDSKLLLVSGFQTQSDQSLMCIAQLWDVKTSKPIGAPMKRDPMDFWRSFNLPSFRPDNRVLVTGGYPLRLWEVPSGKPLGTLNQLAYLGVRSPKFSRDGKSLYIFRDQVDQRMILDPAPGLQPVQRLEIPMNNYLGFDVSPDGRWIVSTYHDPRLQIEGDFSWSFGLLDLETGKAVCEPIQLRSNFAYDLPTPAFSPDGRNVLTPVEDKAFQVWDSATGRERGPRLKMNASVRALAYSPDGRWIAGGDHQGEVRLWNALTGESIGPAIAHQHKPIFRLRFSADSNKLLIGSFDNQSRGQAQVWNLTTRKPIAPPVDTLSEINDVAFSRDSKSFVTASRFLTLWETDSSQPLWMAPIWSPTKSVSFSPDGRRILVTFVQEDSARLFDAKTGTPMGPHLRHKTQGVAASFSPDGQLVLTASADRTARLWDTATGLPIGPVWKNLLRRSEGSFTPDGRGVLLFEDGFISRWDIPDPIEGTPERIRLAVEVATRFSLDEYGGTQLLAPTYVPDLSSRDGRKLGPDLYELARKRLLGLGGPPGYFRR